MSLTEAEFRSVVVRQLASLYAFPVENAVDVGTPDVCCTAGWIELKLATMPRRRDSRVVVNLRPAQRLWLRRWREFGGFAWTLTLVDDHVWLLHDGLWAAMHLGEVDREVLSIARIPMEPDGSDIVHALMNSRKTMRRTEK